MSGRSVVPAMFTTSSRYHWYHLSTSLVRSTAVREVGTIRATGYPGTVMVLQEGCLETMM